MWILNLGTRFGPYFYLCLIEAQPNRVAISCYGVLLSTFGFFQQRLQFCRSQFLLLVFHASEAESSVHPLLVLTHGLGHLGGELLATG